MSNKNKHDDIEQNTHSPCSSLLFVNQHDSDRLVPFSFCTLVWNHVLIVKLGPRQHKNYYYYFLEACLFFIQSTHTQKHFFFIQSIGARLNASLFHSIGSNNTFQILVVVVGFFFFFFQLFHNNRVDRSRWHIQNQRHTVVTFQTNSPCCVFVYQNLRIVCQTGIIQWQHNSSVL